MAGLRASTASLPKAAAAGVQEAGQGEGRGAGAAASGRQEAGYGGGGGGGGLVLAPPASVPSPLRRPRSRKGSEAGAADDPYPPHAAAPYAQQDQEHASEPQQQLRQLLSSSIASLLPDDASVLTGSIAFASMALDDLPAPEDVVPSVHGSTLNGVAGAMGGGVRSSAVEEAGRSSLTRGRAQEQDASLVSLSAAASRRSAVGLATSGARRSSANGTGLGSPGLLSRRLSAHAEAEPARASGSKPCSPAAALAAAAAAVASPAPSSAASSSFWGPEQEEVVGEAADGQQAVHASLLGQGGPSDMPGADRRRSLSHAPSNSTAEVHGSPYGGANGGSPGTPPRPGSAAQMHTHSPGAVPRPGSAVRDEPPLGGSVGEAADTVAPSSPLVSRLSGSVDPAVGEPQAPQGEAPRSSGRPPSRLRKRMGPSSPPTGSTSLQS